MLSKLFRSRARFDDPDPENRRRAVVGLSEEDAKGFQADLAELARTDADRAVRRAALGRLIDSAELERFLTDADPDLARLAAEGIAAYGTDPRRFDRPEIRRAAIRAARDPEAVLPLLGDVPYDSELVALAVEARHPRVRLAAAQLLVKESSLVELERASRDRDKNVNRHARSRLDEIRHARADVEKTDRRADELLRTLAAQSALVERDPLFAAKLGVMRQDWQANVERHEHAVGVLRTHGVAAESLAARTAQFAELVDQAAARLAAVAPPQAAPAPVREATDSGAFADALARIEDLLDRIRRGGADPLASYDALHEESLRAQDAWLASADHAPPPQPLADRFHRATHALREIFDAVGRAQHAGPDIDAALVAPDAASGADADAAPATPEAFEKLWQSQRQLRAHIERIGRLLARIDWPADTASPARLAALDAHRQSLVARDAEIHRLHEALVARITTLIATLDGEIDAGNLTAATAHETEGRRLLKQLPAGTAKRLQTEFSQRAARVGDLKDWVTYATHPKREEYLAEMEALAATPLEPAQQAERIRELRAAWKGLGPVTNPADRRLFDRFNAAAERAFEPCRAYFEEQSGRRRFNLEQRTKICDDLTLYLDKTDWSHPDWRAAERILMVARDEWRKFHPVDRSPGRKLDTRFDALTARLHELIKGEWDRNVAKKQAIVTEAAAIRDGAADGHDGADGREAAEQIKALQRRWRDVGITPRRVDQRLWRDFRAICDEVFGRREAARAERREAIGNELRQAEQILEQFQRELDAAHENGADAAVAREFSERFHAITGLPRDAGRRLESRFREIEKAYRLLLRHAERRKLTSGADRLEAIDAALSAVELAFFDGTVDATAAEARLATLPGFDPAAPGPFAPRLARFRDALRTPGTRVDDAAVGGARRALAIEMEIVAGLDTPPEDQSRRLQLQVERLNRKQRNTLDDDPMRLAERWCAIGPIAEEDVELRERFFQACREALH